MNEVSCKVFELAALCHDKIGIPKETLLAGLSNDWAYLSKPGNRMGWAEWMRLTENAYAAVGAEALAAVNQHWALVRGQAYYRRLAGFFVSQDLIYLRLLPMMVKSVYSILVCNVTRQPDGSFDVVVDIPAEYTASKNFLDGGRFAFATLPCLVGLPIARVEQLELTGRHSLHRIYPPPDKTLWRRLRVLPGSIVASVSFFRILREQNAELTISYAQLEQQTTNLGNILFASSDGIAVVREGRLLHANPALALLLRASSTESLIGQSTERWADPVELARLRSWADLHPAETDRRELRLLIPGGDPVYVELAAPRQIIWENQSATLWLLRDITERRALETAVATARQREQASLARDLHDGLGQYLTGLAFKLKALETRLTRAGSSEAAAACEMVQIANLATTQARDIAHGLAPVDLDPQGLVPALRLLCANVSHLFQIACTLAAPDQPPVLPRAMANQLYRAAQEAITNAHRHGRAKLVELRLTLPAPDQITLSIDDHGVGLPADFQRPASGLGLKIMRHRLASIGGSVQLGKSPATCGTRVLLSAPLASPPTSHEDPAATVSPHFDAGFASPTHRPASSPPPPNPDHSTRRVQRVLLADDHAIVRTGLSQLLGQTGDFVACGEAADSATAEALCATLCPDLLITDMLFGEATALDSLRRLRGSHPALRIVVLSMYSRELYAEAARDAGADAYVTKQSSPDELLATLRALAS